MFERFARGDTSRSRKGGSTGLGLAIVSAVVKAHHGTITVDSAPGRTDFTVRLPLQRVATARASRRCRAVDYLEIAQEQVTSISKGLFTGCIGLAMSTPVAVPLIVYLLPSLVAVALPCAGAGRVARASPR